MMLLHLYSKENNWGCFRRPETDKTERISRGQTSRHLDINVVTSQAVTLATLGDVGKLKSNQDKISERQLRLAVIIDTGRRDRFLLKVCR